MLAKTTPTKAQVATKLRKYDRMRMALRKLEHDLKRDCAEYGRTIGVWGFHPDHLRMQLEREKEGK